jgi:hypothetical protein
MPGKTASSVASPMPRSLAVARISRRKASNAAASSAARGGCSSICAVAVQMCAATMATASRIAS